MQPGPDQTNALHSRPVVVPAEWLDLYGHMNAARYFDVFVATGYSLLSQVGFDEAYARDRRCGIFLVDARIQYFHELRLGSCISLRLRILQADARRIQVLIEMLDDAQGHVAALLQQLFVHVSLETRRSAPFETPLRERIGQLIRQHGECPLPNGVQRRLDWRRHSP